MHPVLRLIVHHPFKFWMVLVVLCCVYRYTRVLVIQYVIGVVLDAVHRHAKSLPLVLAGPVFYCALLLAFVAGMFHDAIIMGSGAWKYVLPLPLTMQGRLYRVVGVPIYACGLGVAEAVYTFRYPSTSWGVVAQVWAVTIRSIRMAFIQSVDIAIHPSMLKSTHRASPTVFAYVRLPTEVILAIVVCFVFGISLFYNEPRHDGDELREAARNNDLPRIRTLLSRGVSPNLRGSDGAAALHICAQQAMSTAAAVLLDFNADPNIADKLGFTPLHWAVQLRREEASNTNRLDMIRLLVRHGANPMQGDAIGRSPLQIAAKVENNPALEVLRECLREVDIDAVLPVAANSNDVSAQTN